MGEWVLGAQMETGGRERSGMEGVNRGGRKCDGEKWRQREKTDNRDKSRAPVRVQDRQTGRLPD